MLTTIRKMDYKDIQPCVDEFLDFLKGSIDKYIPKFDGDKYGEWHAIFKGGTVAKIDPVQNVPEFQGYTDSYREGYPVHRVSSDALGDLLQANVDVWNRQKDKLDGDKGKALRIAYSMLISDGYPYPGGEGSDRIPIPITDPSMNPEPICMVIWSHRDPYLHNIVKGNVNVAVGLSADLRRYDFMMPEVYAIINPTGTPTYL